MHREKCIPVPIALVNKVLQDEKFPRGEYAKNILLGRLLLSGADIRGAAARYPFYGRQRYRVEKIAAEYGIVPIYDKDKNGLKVFSIMRDI